MSSSNSTAKMLEVMNKSKHKDALQVPDSLSIDNEHDEHDLFPSLGSILEHCLNPNNSKDSTPQS